MSTFFSSGLNSSLKRPPTPAQRSAELRHKVHKLRPIVTVEQDLTDKTWAETRRHIEENKDLQKPSLILVSLKAELQAVGDDPLRRVAAHRRAFEILVRAAEGAQQEVLRLIYEEYERSAFKGVSDTYNLLLAEKNEVDKLNRSLLAENARMERRIAEMELHTMNLERKLRRQTEQLREISSEFCVPLRFSDTRDEAISEIGLGINTRTLADIRAHQEEVRVKVAGLDGKEALTREKLDAIDRQLAADCAAAEEALIDISQLSGATPTLDMAPRNKQSENSTPSPAIHQVAEGDQNARRDTLDALPTADIAAGNNRTMNPPRALTVGGQVCANLEDDAEEYL